VHIIFITLWAHKKHLFAVKFFKTGLSFLLEHQDFLKSRKLYYYNDDTVVDRITVTRLEIVSIKFVF